MRYQDGREMHAGDRVMHAGRPAMIVAVMSSGEFSTGYAKEDWDEFKTGFLIRDDTGELFMYDTANEDIELLSRAS